MYQLHRLLDAPAEQIDRQTFYLSDYDVFTIRRWSNLIAQKLHRGRVRAAPEAVVRGLALGGDLLQSLGFKRAPLTTFRLKNMRADTSRIPLGPTEAVTGSLPFSLEQGVDQTIHWMRRAA
ncbi:MAG: hypothetical protein KDA41_07930 [Planctomycetales bacterium]|nr:hypothetical protein [Planctomycetales bacterium]